ncbi:MAG: HEAT repeat domain-containing protein [Deltaproteobacteria bacterium]|nr:HEAT repeat domain-containing protein [Deltaproteobacteria bacterium]
MRSTRIAALVLGLVTLAAAAGAVLERPRAAGGVRLVEAAETAPVTVVGHVLEPRRLDQHGYTAVLQVETSVRGPLEPGAEVRIAWEELAASRAPRFRQGDRILVSLERLAGASIWHSRFPEPTERVKVLGVAMRGDAFLQRPSLGSASVLQHYLALTAEDRDGAAGAGYLVDLALGAELPLAGDALRRLARHAQLDAGLDADLGEGGGGRLVRAMLRPDASDEFQDGIVELIGSRQLESTRPALEALVGAEATPPAIVFAALARLDGGLSPERTAALLERSPARYREVAARFASGPQADATLARLAGSDPAPEVRARAIERLVERRGEEAIDSVVPGLWDPEPAVRGAAVRGLGSLGAPAVPALKRVIEDDDPEAARSALAALAINGSPDASAALHEVAETHPDETLRTLAEIALGRPVGH